MKTLALQCCALIAFGAFSASDSLINLIVAGAGVVGAVFAFQRWVEGRIEHKLSGKVTILLLEIDVLRVELGLHPRHQHLAAKKGDGA